MNEHISDVKNAEQDAVMNDAEQWIKDNYKEIMSAAQCQACGEYPGNLMADVTDKKAQFTECKECATQRIYEDLLEELYN